MLLTFLIWYIQLKFMMLMTLTWLYFFPDSETQKIVRVILNIPLGVIEWPFKSFYLEAKKILNQEVNDGN